MSTTNLVITLIFSLIILIFCIFQSIYWYHIVQQFDNNTLVSNTTTVTRNTAQILMITSIIASVLLLLFMVYTIYVLFTNDDSKQIEYITKLMTPKFDPKAATIVCSEKRRDELPKKTVRIQQMQDNNTGEIKYRINGQLPNIEGNGVTKYTVDSPYEPLNYDEKYLGGVVMQL